MASNRSKVVGLVVSMVMVMVKLCGGTTAQSSGCRTALVSLSPCIDYVNGNSSVPSSSCCSQLANVVKSQPRCLCALVDTDQSTMTFKMNETLALGLPAACHVHTPPVSRCDGGNVSQTVPPTAKSDGTMIKLPFYLKFLFLFLIEILN